jgi:hypothetical protein
VLQTSILTSAGDHQLHVARLELPGERRRITSNILMIQQSWRPQDLAARRSAHSERMGPHDPKCTSLDMSIR